MLHYDRHLRALGAELRHRAWMSPAFRIYELTTRGVTVEYGLLPKQPLAERVQINIVRQGRLTVRRGGRSFVLEEGLAFRECGLSFDERWEGEPFRALCLDWSDRQGWPPEVVALSPQARAQLAALEPGDVDGVLALLEGLGWRPPVSWYVEPSPELQRIATVYGRVLSDLESQPMWCDFVDEIGMSERQLRRHLREMLGWFPVPMGEQSFRRMLASYRMRCGVALMSAPGASVASVARALGYGSAIAYTNACKRAGLGAPSEFKRKMEAMG